MVANLLDVKLEDKQALLETFDLGQRLDRVRRQLALRGVRTDHDGLDRRQADPKGQHRQLPISAAAGPDGGGCCRGDVHQAILRADMVVDDDGGGGSDAIAHGDPSRSAS